MDELDGPNTIKSKTPMHTKTNTDVHRREKKRGRVVGGGEGEEDGSLESIAVALGPRRCGSRALG